jgi:hypothetical protein
MKSWFDIVKEITRTVSCQQDCNARVGDIVATSREHGLIVIPGSLIYMGYGNAIAIGWAVKVSASAGEDKAPDNGVSAKLRR